MKHVMCLSHSETITLHLWKKLSSMKLVPDAKRFGDLCSQVLLSLDLEFLKEVPFSCWEIYSPVIFVLLHFLQYRFFHSLSCCFAISLSVFVSVSLSHTRLRTTTLQCRYFAHSVVFMFLLTSLKCTQICPYIINRVEVTVICHI